MLCHHETMLSAYHDKTLLNNSPRTLQTVFHSHLEDSLRILSKCCFVGRSGNVDITLNIAHVHKTHIKYKD